MTDSQIAETMGSSGYCVCENYLDSSHVSELQSDFQSIYRAGRFQRAAVGQGVQNEVRNQVRTDETFWLEPTELDIAQKKLLRRCDELRTAINHTLFLGLKDFEGHYASYDVGGYYRRHLDTFSGDNRRIVSVVIYLNDSWKNEDGGQLRIFSESTYLDVSPNAGTLVCFLSREIEHEVLKSNARRRGFSGWYTRPA